MIFFDGLIRAILYKNYNNNKKAPHLPTRGWVSGHESANLAIRNRRMLPGLSTQHFRHGPLCLHADQVGAVSR
jgi:hypothetical protein